MKKPQTINPWIKDHVVSVWYRDDIRSMYLFQSMTRHNVLIRLPKIVGEGISRIEFEDAVKKDGYLYLCTIRPEKEE